MYAGIVCLTFLTGCMLLPSTHAVQGLRFFIIGDMGGIDYEPYSTYVERSTAVEMAKLANLYSPNAILALGDNIYYDGVQNVHDSRFSKTFENVYVGKSLFVPWYLVAGNHDHHGSVDAQIDYSNYSTRWNFPDYFYYREFPIAGTSQTVGFAFIDTILLCGDSHDLDRSQPKPRRFNKDKYWDKVKDMLKHSTATYLFSAGHFPVYSIGSHGPTKCLTDDLQPMLEKYNVNGHLCGHDHNLQHLKVTDDDGDDIHYFVSGMANFIDPAIDNVKKVPKGSLRFHNADYFTRGGFLYAEATSTNMTFTFISANGEKLYSTVLFPRF